MTAPAYTQEPAAAPAGRASWIPALLACAAAIVCWSMGEDWRQEMGVLTQQLNSAATSAARGKATEVSAARTQAASAQTQREATEARLRSADGIEMVIASLTADLRQKCLESMAANCVVRLAEDSLSRRPADVAAAAAANAAATLEGLNIQRARASISGSFQNDEPTRLTRAIMDDGTRTWRINGVVVRANTFEIDVERLVIVTPAGVQKR